MEVEALAVVGDGADCARDVDHNSSIVRPPLTTLRASCVSCRYNHLA